MYRSQYLFDHIDELIDDDEVWPICVPSYNRPDASFLQYVDNVPVILFIRKEQAVLYKQYKGRCRIVKIDGVEEIGQTRAKIVDWAAEHGYDNIFMLDDDILHLTFNQPAQTSSGKWAMKRYTTITNQAEGIYDEKVFKMWMWLARRCDERLTISAPGALSDWWNIRYKDSETVYNSGSCIQCIHLNIKNMVEQGINYIDTREGGTEDYTLQYQVMTAGLYTAIFKDLAFRAPAVGGPSGGNTTDQDLIDKYENFIRLFNENILQPEDEYRVSTKTAKSGIPSVKFDWPKWHAGTITYDNSAILESLSIV